MHLRQSALTYSACGPFTKNKKEYKKLRKQGIQDIFYENKIEKACFQHNWLMLILNIYIYIYICSKSHLQNIKISLSLNIIETLKYA